MWAGYFDAGNVKIVNDLHVDGTSRPNKLIVAGNITASGAGPHVFSGNVRVGGSGILEIKSAKIEISPKIKIKK